MFFHRRIDRRLDALARALAQHHRDIEALKLAVQQSTPTLLAARIDDLCSALDQHRAAQRRELGKLWVKFNGRQQLEADLSNVDGSDVDAMLRLQSAPPAQPK